MLSRSTRRWVVLSTERNRHEDPYTVMTERHDPLAGRRVVRGREAECQALYTRPACTEGSAAMPTAPSPDARDARARARACARRSQGRGPGQPPPRPRPRARALLRTGSEIDWRAQLAMQATAQAAVDGAVSKTLQLPPGATPARVLDAIRFARRARLKGLACYRARRMPVCIDCRGVV